MISVRNLSKLFKLYADPLDRLKESVHPLRKQYHRKFYALKDITFDIHPGETVGIVGRNGSGKSTLLKIISGVLTPTSGECRVNGKVSAILELGSGFNPELSGLENVFFSGMLMGYEREEMEELLDPILSFADIGDFVHQPVKTYSSGMMVRLAFSVQTMVNAQILIVDEALAVGDEAFQRKCFARLEMLRQQGCTLLYVSHASTSVVSLCNRALLLHRGELLLNGRPKYVVTNYQRIAHAPAEELDELVDALRQGRQQDRAEEEAREQETAAGAGEVTASEACASSSYDPNLQPKSTERYQPQGAEIVDVGIASLSGEPVNILQRGEYYVYRYRVRFDEDCAKVRFAMLLKNNQGYPLGGAASHPTTRGVDSVAAGATYEVRFTFRCNLAAGAYFLNAGVEGISGSKTPVFLHRIMDAAMFRVEDAPDTLLTGIVDFEFDPEFAPVA